MNVTLRLSSRLRGVAVPSTLLRSKYYCTLATSSTPPPPPPDPFENVKKSFDPNVGAYLVLVDISKHLAEMTRLQTKHEEREKERDKHRETKENDKSGFYREVSGAVFGIALSVIVVAIVVS